MPAVIAVLKGGRWAVEPQRTGNEMVEYPFLVDPKTMQRYEMYTWDRERGRTLNPTLGSLEGVVAVVPISGPILKYNGDCGEPGSITRVGWLQMVDNMPNVTAVVILWDTPGGMVDGTATLSNTIKSMKKFTISYVDDGMCCSAGMWGATSANEFYASKKTDTVGSVGVLCTLADFTGYYEQLGITVQTVYAPQSEDKNKEYRQWQETGDSSLVAADLGVIADEFIASIKANRPDAVRTEAKWNKGASFFADEALKYHLIDGIMPLEKVIKRAHFKGKSQQKMSKETTAANSAANSPVATVLQVTGATELPVIAAGDVSPDAGFLLTEEQLNALGSHISAAADKSVEQAASIATLQQQLETAKAANQAAAAAQTAETATQEAAAEAATAEEDTTSTQLATENAELKQELAALKAQVAELSGKPSGTGTDLKASPTPAGKGTPDWYQPDGSETKLERV